MESNLPIKIRPFSPVYEKQVIDLYNTPQKLDKGIRWMLACHPRKETRYGQEYAKGP
jgi:hypothetical protein